VSAVCAGGRWRRGISVRGSVRAVRLLLPDANAESSSRSPIRAAARSSLCLTERQGRLAIAHGGLLMLHRPWRIDSALAMWKQMRGPRQF
jgi:hypothetical protein